MAVSLLSSAYIMALGPTSWEKKHKGQGSILWDLYSL